jgi:hypothetical protein
LLSVADNADPAQILSTTAMGAAQLRILMFVAPLLSPHFAVQAKCSFDSGAAAKRV